MGKGSKGNGKLERRGGGGRRDESQDQRQADRRLGDRRMKDRRLRRRRAVVCSRCGSTLSQNDFCSNCQVRVIRIRKRS